MQESIEYLFVYGLTSYNCVGQDIDKLELTAGSYDGPIIKVLVGLKGFDSDDFYISKLH